MSEFNPYEAPLADIRASSEREWHYCGCSTRVAAYLIDWILLGGLFLGSLYLLAGERELFSFTKQYEVNVQIAAVGLQIAYFLGFWVWKGATPGKALFGIRIVDAHTGELAQPWRYIVRMVFWILGSLPLWLGQIWVAFDKRKRGWHDLAAGTVVVFEFDPALAARVIRARSQALGIGTVHGRSVDEESGTVTSGTKASD